MCSTNAPYLLDNAAAEAPARLAALASMYDATTTRHLLARGVGPGWCCLEVGGGNGSIASWLANRTAPSGRVVATDLDTRFLDTVCVPNLDVLRHDITRDALPDRTFDLIHARLVLVHLEQWEQVLERLIAALVAEEFDSDSLPPDPAASDGEVLLETYLAVARLMTDRGFDRPANYRQLREQMIDASYVTAKEVDADLARLDDEDFMMPSSILWSVWGQRPDAP
jgi:trans-aconitate methyltransferase